MDRIKMILVERVANTSIQSASTSGARGADCLAVMQVSELRERLNQFLHRQNIRKLTPEERSLAREWCLDLIHREHPELNDEQAELFYENLINVRIITVDEWSRRMEGSF
jgi:hypothetical protein